MRMAVDALKNATLSKRSYTPLQLFTNSQVQPNTLHFHHFVTPVYVLSQALQGSTGIYHKWKERARIGLYLGRSKDHARSVALVFNLKTAMVSPQFHIKFDPTFQTIEGPNSPESRWQMLCGFIRNNKKVKDRNT